MAVPDLKDLKRRWTAAERDALPDDGNRYEVLDGELFVTPAPAWRHQAAVKALARILDDYVEAQHLGYVFFAPADVVFTQLRALQPDVFVVPLVNDHRPEHFDEVRRLLLAAEVLSPSTARADRVAKRRIYRDEQVPEYWIIDLDARTVERNTPNEPRPEIVIDTLEWMPEGVMEPLVIDLPAYFGAVLDG